MKHQGHDGGLPIGRERMLDAPSFAMSFFAVPGEPPDDATLSSHAMVCPYRLPSVAAC
ncbi:hypothetical protein [Robbsia andropogonis]|uniref:hypothetical protein n=1 Tax=Robbsia andropogonis TaxID=28092 RepID=UPI0004B2A830|nr:hypothetical protein [Robbsia andropogonis]MCP1116641.1 hypothetical protein [Robbsia andropogonis]MCP1126680.1 hypothetical protein [Robbsia andropogonis]